MARFLSTSDMMDEIGWVKCLHDGGGQAGAGVLAIAGTAASQADDRLEKIRSFKKERIEALKMLRAEVRAAKKRMLTFYRPDEVDAAIAEHQKKLDEARKLAEASKPAPDPEASKKSKRGAK